MRITPRTQGARPTKATAYSAILRTTDRLPPTHRDWSASETQHHTGGSAEQWENSPGPSDQGGSSSSDAEPTPGIPALPSDSDQTVGGANPPSGGAIPTPGGDTPPPGGDTPAPGGDTPAPGGDTPAPGGDTPAPGGQNPPVGGSRPMPGGEMPTPGGAHGPAAGEPANNCDHMEVLARNSCQAAGCHATPVQAGLDLTRDNLHRTLLNAPSQSPGCNGRVLIDPRRPERSLFLQAIGAVEAPGGDDDTCQVVMPPQGRMPDADRACLAQWIRGIAAANQPEEIDEEEAPIHAALTKLKTLVHGGPLTSEEVESVVRARNERSGIRALLNRWISEPEFESKMYDFLGVALQQRTGVFDENQLGRLRSHRNYRARISRVMEESFIRTAFSIIQRGESFTRIAQTNRWMVTTANLAFLSFGDQNQQEREQRHRLFSNIGDAPRSLAQQIRQRRWYIPHDEIGQCEVRQSSMLEVLMGAIRRRG